MSEASSRDSILQTERAKNEAYRRSAEQWIEETKQLVAVGTALSKNSIWVSGSASVGGPSGGIHPVVGRVGFAEAEASPVDGDLYIGPFYQEMQGFTVVSWAAPVAELFYRGRSSSDVAAQRVSARRTFTASGTDLADYVDDYESGFDQRSFESKQERRLNVPAPPPGIAKRPSQVSMSPVSGAVPENLGRAREESDPSSDPESSQEVDDVTTRVGLRGGLHDSGAAVSPDVSKTLSEGDPSKGVSSIGDGSQELPEAFSMAESSHGANPSLRAEALIQDIVSRPRTGKLSALLATLQEDQFDLVSWPADQPLIISGQPGTGKTVVALHRAAYLTHPQRAGGPLQRVVVVGPSDEYREHVHLVSEAAGGRKVPVVGVNELLSRIAGIDYRKVEPGQHDRLGVDWKLRSVALMAARRTAAVQGNRNLFDKTLLELLSPGAIHRECVKDRDLSDWLLAIESPESVRRHAKYLPLAAAVGLGTRSNIDDQVDHLIVDEAQDIPPLVWLLMLSLLKVSGSLTILGDLNQRRSDWTASSWDQLAQDLEITDEAGRAPVRELTTGYRSTREILRFANQLLVRDERKNHALREGTPPVVERIGRNELVKAAIGRAKELSDRRGAGLTAIISVDPRPFSDAFRNGGWRRPHDLREAWTDGASTVFVLHPDRARGLEFDSVIVIEPDAFPKNVGREGVLYTSLTRATQELHVLYAGKLPNNLRPPRAK